MTRQTISSSAFQEINAWDDESVIYNFVPEEASLIETDNTKLLLILEKIHTSRAGDFMSANTLEKLAPVISGKKPKGKKRDTINKSRAEKLAKILHAQSKILIALAETYKLMAIALEASMDNFEEIVKEDKHIKRSVENPF